LGSTHDLETGDGPEDVVASDDDDEGSDSDEKPALPKSAATWRIQNVKKPIRGKGKRKEISPSHGAIPTSNHFEIPKRVKNT
jgi:hypothetical protein